MRHLFTFCLILLALSLLISCDNANQQGKNTIATPNSTLAPPSGREASRLETTTESLLADLKDMTFTEAEAIQDYADSISRNNWGQVTAVLRKKNPTFKYVGDSLLAMEGEANIAGQKIAATMVLDLKENQVFAGQYNFETQQLDRWPPGDSLKIPAALSNWILIYQLNYLSLDLQ